MPNYVIEGPRWFRTRIRSQGPFVALIVPAVLGAIALIALNSATARRRGLIGLVLGVFAAPALLAVGAPFSSASLYPIGVAISVVLWLVRGSLAARRATRNPMARGPTSGATTGGSPWDLGRRDRRARSSPATPSAKRWSDAVEPTESHRQPRSDGTASQLGRADAAHVLEGRRPTGERSVLLPVVDDRRGGRRTDPGRRRAARRSRG